MLGYGREREKGTDSKNASLQTIHNIRLLALKQWKPNQVYWQLINYNWKTCIFSLWFLRHQKGLMLVIIFYNYQIQSTTCRISEQLLLVTRQSLGGSVSCLPLLLPATSYFWSRHLSLRIVLDCANSFFYVAFCV